MKREESSMTDTRSTKSRFAVLLVAVAAVAMLAFGSSTAFAARAAGGGKHGGGGGGTTGGTGSISLVLLNSTDGLAHYGQNVTFKVATTATTQPWVGLKCSRNGALLGESYEGMFAGSLSDGIFTLASPSWTGGAADCTATLMTPQWQALGSTSFHVYA
jgi:hypothetical protein